VIFKNGASVIARHFSQQRLWLFSTSDEI